MPDVGDKVSIVRKITKRKVNAFAGLNNDYNIIHLNKTEAQKEGFKDVVVQGMLCVSFIGTAMWILGGEGTLFGELQKLRFIRPVFVKDTIIVEAEISEVKPPAPSKRYYKCVLTISIKNQSGENIIEPTQATMFVPGKE